MGRDGPLGQVFRNLIDNARSFSPPGGEVRVALRRDDADEPAGADRASRTTAPASRPRTWRRCSSASTPRGPRARPSAPTRASACRSCARSSRPTAAGSRPRTGPDADGAVVGRPVRGRPAAAVGRRGVSGQPIHATAVARCRPGAAGAACCSRARPGAGKSDLALRLIGAGWRLVADDYVHVWRLGRRRSTAAAPTPIAGRIEARGLGIVAGLRRGWSRVWRWSSPAPGGAGTPAGARRRRPSRASRLPLLWLLDVRPASAVAKWSRLRHRPALTRRRLGAI